MNLVNKLNAKNTAGSPIFSFFFCTSYNIIFSRLNFFHVLNKQNALLYACIKTWRALRLQRFGKGLFFTKPPRYGAHFINIYYTILAEHSFWGLIHYQRFALLVYLFSAKSRWRSRETQFTVKTRPIKFVTNCIASRRIIIWCVPNPLQHVIHGGDRKGQYNIQTFCPPSARSTSHIINISSCTPYNRIPGNVISHA